MTSVLETLMAFVGTMLVLALVAESLQELIKVTFAIKSRVALNAMRGLIREAAGAHEQMHTDGDDILADVVRRLQALGQKGFGKKGIRLDTLSPQMLRQLIESVDTARISGLAALGDDAQGRIRAIALQACVWYPLAIGPTDNRYRRRMRALALATSAAVVLAVNADAFRVLTLVRSDEEMRSSLIQEHAGVRSAETAVRALTDSLTSMTAALPDTVPVPAAAESLGVRLEAARAQRHSVVRTQTARLTDILGGPGQWERRNPVWWIGILFSTFLVSLGAPFWHDALEALFGLKNKVRAAARRLRETPSGSGVSQETPAGP